MSGNSFLIIMAVIGLVNVVCMIVNIIFCVEAYKLVGLFLANKVREGKSDHCSGEGCCSKKSIEIVKKPKDEVKKEVHSFSRENNPRKGFKSKKSGNRSHNYKKDDFSELPD